MLSRASTVTFVHPIVNNKHFSSLRFNAKMNSAKRKQSINLKLVELIKPHGILHRRAKRNEDTQVRSRLWNEISAEMNKTFNLDRRK